MIKTFDHSISTNPGSPIHIIYKPVVDAKGNIDLVESGKENTDEIINSFKDSCDISVILANAANGDLSGLQKVRGNFGDFTNMPKTYAEYLQLQIDSKIAFDSLPPEVKKEFNNDANQFLMDAGTENWLKKLGIGVEKNTESEQKGETITESE